MRLCWSQDPFHRPTMAQCVQWTSGEEFDRLRTEIILGSCTSIACACVSRIEPELEAEWIRDNGLKTDVDGSLLTKEEIERFGLHTQFERLTSQMTESIIERTDNSTVLTNSTDDEGVGGESSLTGDIPLEDATNVGRRRDSIYVTSTSLEVTKNVTSNLLRKRNKHLKSDSPSKDAAATAPSVETSYTQIWMCGRDKKKGLLAVFILPDNQKNIYVSCMREKSDEACWNESKHFINRRRVLLDAPG